MANDFLLGCVWGGRVGRVSHPQALVQSDIWLLLYISQDCFFVAFVCVQGLCGLEFQAWRFRLRWVECTLKP